MFNTAELFVSRLTEVEKLELRNASEDKIDWLYYNMYRHELVGSIPEGLKMVRDALVLINITHRKQADADTFGLTWKF